MSGCFVHAAVEQSAAPVLDHCPLGQLEQLLGVSQLESYVEWPFREQEAGGMNLPASQSVQSLENVPGEHHWVHEQSAALQYATRSRKSMHFMAEPWGMASGLAEVSGCRPARR
jgi:hypothetical protein